MGENQEAVGAELQRAKESSTRSGRLRRSALSLAPLQQSEVGCVSAVDRKRPALGVGIYYSTTMAYPRVQFKNIKMSFYQMIFFNAKDSQATRLRP